MYILKNIIQKMDIPLWAKEVLIERLKKNFQYNSKLSYLKQVQKKLDNSCIISKILGEKGFYEGIFINKEVLDPRWDTECILEDMIKTINNEFFNKNIKFLELGVGSGCVLISVMQKVNSIQATGVDICYKALQITCRNARRSNVYPKLVQSDWMQWNKTEKFDIIFSNPPYLSEKEYEKNELLFDDPRKALVGGKYGTEPYEIILRDTKKFCNHYLFLEICTNKLKEILLIAENHEWYFVRLIYDIENRVRGIVVSPNKPQ
jgi:release factor glutamine methyltransferase